VRGDDTQALSPAEDYSVAPGHLNY